MNREPVMCPIVSSTSDDTLDESEHYGSIAREMFEEVDDDEYVTIYLSDDPELDSPASPDRESPELLEGWDDDDCYSNERSLS